MATVVIGCERSDTQCSASVSQLSLSEAGIEEHVDEILVKGILPEESCGGSPVTYEPVLHKSRWCPLKLPENLTAQQTVRLSEILKYNLKSVRAYLLNEDFQRFWDYVSPLWAGKFLDEWTGRMMKSKLEPLKKVALTLRSHRELILNLLQARGQISAGAVEGLNNKVKVVTRMSFGFRTANIAKLALLHNLGRLPVPIATHTFC